MTMAYLKSTEVAQRLGIANQTLAKWRWAHEGPRFVKLGKAVRYSEADLAAWLDANAREPQS